MTGRVLPPTPPPSLGTGALPGPGLHPPGLQPHLERLDLEVDTAVGIRLQRRQGAHGRRQQREGLQQSQEHHEELQARQRLAQAHARPAAKCQRAGVRARLQEAVCGRAEGPIRVSGAAGLRTPLRRHAPAPAPPTPATRPPPPDPRSDRGHPPRHTPGRNSCGCSQTVSSRWAPWRLGITTMPSGMS